MEVWPLTLPQDLLVNGFGHTLGNGLIEDEMEVGPPAYRRRTAAAPEPLAGTMIMTEDEWEIFFTFFHATLADGALRFEFPAQGTTDDSDIWVLRFTSPPQRQRPDSNDYWMVALNLERLHALAAAGSP